MEQGDLAKRGKLRGLFDGAIHQMYHRRWRRNVAIGATAVLAIGTFGGGHWFLGYQREHAEQRRDAAAYQANALQSDLAFACYRLPPERFVACMSAALEADREDRERRYDLNAQQDMAEWAAGILLVSILSFAVSVCGLVLLLRNLALQREATTASVAQARAAERADAPQLSVDVQPLVAIYPQWGFAGAIISKYKLAEAPLYPEINRFIVETNCSVQNYGSKAAVHVHFDAGFRLVGIESGDNDTILREFCESVREEDGAYVVDPNKSPRALTAHATIEKADLARIAKRPGTGLIGLWPVLCVCVSYRSPSSARIVQIGQLLSIRFTAYGYGGDFQTDEWLKAPVELHLSITRHFEEN